MGNGNIQFRTYGWNEITNSAYAIAGSTLVSSDVNAIVGTAASGFFAASDTDIMQVDQFGQVGNSQLLGSTAGPLHLNFSATDRLYVLQEGQGKVSVYDKNLGFLYDFASNGSGAEQLSGATDLEVSRTGNIYITDKGNNRLQRWFDPTEWVDAGTNTFTDLTLGQSFTLDSGKQMIVNDALSLGVSDTVTINGGALTVGQTTGGRIRLMDGILTVTGTTIASRFSGARNATLEALGNLSIGDATRVDGFTHDGELIVGHHMVTLNDLNRSTLGVLTTIGDGTLVADNGLFVDFDGNITGHGTIYTTDDPAKATIINGAVVGDSPIAGLTMTGYVKGVGSFDNVTFTGTYSPGLSPSVVYLGSVSVGETATLEIELGGTTIGDFDRLVSSGTLTLDGTVKVIFIDGFMATDGDSFDVLDFNTFMSNGYSFDFSQASLGAGLSWDTSDFASTGTLTVVPEPSSLALLGLGGLSLLRRRRVG